MTAPSGPTRRSEGPNHLTTLRVQGQGPLGGLGQNTVTSDSQSQVAVSQKVS
jgi:hypothetical protein